MVLLFLVEMIYLSQEKGKQKPKRKTTKTKLNEPKEKENELCKTTESKTKEQKQVKLQLSPKNLQKKHASTVQKNMKNGKKS